MGTNQVAEGPLIKHVPGGFAEFRAKESGLPPARLNKSDGEWWGKLVGPTDTTTTDTTTTDPIKVDQPDPIVQPVNGFTDEEKQGMDDPSFEAKLRDELNKEQDQPNYNWYDQTVDQGGLTEYTPKFNYEVKVPPIPKGFGYGVSPDSPALPYQGGLGGLGGGGSSGGGSGGSGLGGGGNVVPGGQGDNITSRGSSGLEGPLVEFKPSPTDYVDGYNPDNRFVEKPGLTEDLKGVATDGLKLGEKWVDAIAGKTAADFKPRNPKEAELFNKFKKGYEIFVAAIKEGGGVFGGTLYETGGGRTTQPSKTGEVPEAHFPNIIKTLKKIFAGEKDPIVMQQYGDMHWPTIIATIGIANTYGPIVWAIPGLRTMADTIGASMNGMFMDKPNLAGNPVQDTMHRLFWVAGQAGKVAYKASIGEIINKLRDKPKSDKETGTIAEEISDLTNIKNMFDSAPKTRAKTTVGGEAYGSRHLRPNKPPVDQPQPEQRKTYKIEFGDGSVHEVDEETYLRETTPNENGVSNARPYEPKDEPGTIDTGDNKGTWFTDVPVDINGNPTSDPEKIHDIKGLLSLDLIEGQNQGEAQTYIDSVTSQWNNLKDWEKGQADKEKEFEWEQPDQRGTELRNYQGDLVNQFGELIDKEGKLLREEGGPKGEDSNYGSGGGYAETDYSKDQLSAKFKAGGGKDTTAWHGFDTAGNEYHIQLKPIFQKFGTGENATYYYKYEQPAVNGVIDTNSSDDMPKGWQQWYPGE